MDVKYIHNIYPMMHLGVDLPADLRVDLLIAILDHWMSVAM